jgi:tetratricopeptide (TPR) repeat protein
MRNKNIIFVILTLALSLTLTHSLFVFQVGGGRLHGTVVDEEGNPIAGVKIVVEAQEKKLTLETESNEEGEWYVSGVEKGEFRITATMKGYESVYADRTLSHFTSKNPPLHFQMKKISEMDDPSIMDETTLGLFQEGNRLFEQGKYVEAISKFEEFLEQNYTIYQVHINIGNCYREIGEYEKAIASFNNVLENVKSRKNTIEGDESASKALANIGEIYLLQDDIEKAGEYFKLAVDSFPGNETIAFNVGEIFFTQGDTDKAIEYFNLSIKIKENWAIPYRRLGYAYLNKGEYQQAIDNFKKFLSLSPDSPDAANIQNLIPKLEELIKK